MYRKSQDLWGLLEPAVASLGYEFVGVERLSDSHGGTLLRLYIDSDSGITVKDCELVSQQVSSLLDVEDPISSQYTLEVSSPGMDRPLLSRQHYERFIGSRVKIKLSRLYHGRRKLKGILQGLQGDSVVIVEDDIECKIPLELVEKARLVPVVDDV